MHRVRENGDKKRNIGDASNATLYPAVSILHFFKIDKNKKEKV
jgi:hypothetical protein